MCRKTFKKGITFFEYNKAVATFEKQRQKNRKNITEWKNHMKKTNQKIDFDQFSFQLENNRKQQIEKRDFFLKFDCSELFPNWIFFLPEMKNTYGIDDSVLINGFDFNGKIDFVYEKDKGETLETVIGIFFEKKPKKYLETEINREKNELFYLYTNAFGDFEKAKIFSKQADAYLSDTKKQLPILSENNQINFVFQTKISKLVCLNNAYNEYDELVKKKRFVAQKNWFNFMKKYEKLLQTIKIGK